MQINSFVLLNIPELLRRVGLKPGQQIGDLGTGREGKLALVAAQIVGASGLVYAVDVIKAILPVVATKAKMHGITNVQTVWSNLEIYGATRAITDNSLDAAFLVTILFQSQKRQDIMHEAYRMVRPGGKLAVVDWQPEVATPFGPELVRRIHPAEIKQYATTLGLQLVDEFALGDYHWGLIFQK